MELPPVHVSGVRRGIGCPVGTENLRVIAQTTPTKGLKEKKKNQKLTATKSENKNAGKRCLPKKSRNVGGIDSHRLKTKPDRSLSDQFSVTCKVTEPRKVFGGQKQRANWKSHITEIPSPVQFHIFSHLLYSSFGTERERSPIEKTLQGLYAGIESFRPRCVRSRKQQQYSGAWS